MERLTEYCRKLRLGGDILREFEEIDFINKKDYLTKVLECSVLAQDIRKKNARIRDARFDVIKTFEGYKFDEIQLSDKITEEDIRKCEFIDKIENLVLYGPSGRGKTHLATAIGVEACNRNKKVRFFKVSNLINELVEAHEKGKLGYYLKTLKKYDLLILDELGYIPIGEKGSELFFQVIADCYERKSLIITTNIEFSKWVGIFMDKKITSAILDRIIHHGHLLIFTGTNWRMENAISKTK